MADALSEVLDLIVSGRLAEVVESLPAARERDPCVLAGWSAQSLERMTGQREVGQADEDQMRVDSVPAKHLVLAQPQAAQFLEQDFDRPASFVDLDDVSGRAARVVGGHVEQIPPGIARPFREHDSHGADPFQLTVHRGNAHISPTAITLHPDLSTPMFQDPWSELFEQAALSPTRAGKMTVLHRDGIPQESLRFACFCHRWTKIERIEQNADLQALGGG